LWLRVVVGVVLVMVVELEQVALELELVLLLPLELTTRLPLAVELVAGVDLTKGQAAAILLS
jgi:hypothetical protein